MFVVYVELRIIPDRMEEFLPMIRKNAAASLEAEPGCLQFDVVQSAEDEDLIQLYERYADEAAFDAHANTPHYKTFREASDDLIRARRIKLGRRLYPTD